MKEVMDEINKEIKNSYSRESSKIVFSNSSYESVPISKDNFVEINNKDSKESKEDIRIAYIDGGNTIILESPNVCVQFIRIYFNIYRNNNKTNSGKHEFFVLTKSKFVHNYILFETKLFNVNNGIMPNEADIQFDPLDSTITQGKNQASISQIGGYVRRFGELMVGLEVSKILEEGDAIVLDGTLESKITNEDKYLDSLNRACKEKGIIVSALAKTTRLFTDTGDNAVDAIRKISPFKSFFYKNIVKINSPTHNAEMFFVKLNEGSDYVFRFEVSKGSEKTIGEIFAILSNQSRDGVFLGYPYGLIDADNNARISNEERNYIRTVFGVNPKTELALNAHSKLDNISY